MREWENFRRVLRSFFLQEVFGRRLPLAAAGACLGLLLEGTPAVLTAFREMIMNGRSLPPVFVRQLVADGLAGSGLRMAVPVLAALPATGAFLEDLKTTRIRQVLSRCGRRPYILGRIITGICCGALVPAAGIFLGWLLLWLIFFPFLEVPAQTLSLLQRDLWFRTGMLALTGSLWNLAGTALSLAAGSAYGAQIGPFVLYYAGIILCRRYFPEIYVLNPDRWLQPETWALGTGSAVAWLLLLLALLAAWIRVLGDRLLSAEKGIGRCG